MEKDTGEQQPVSPPQEPIEPPPRFQPDPELVTYLERGAKPGPKEEFRAEFEKRG